MQRTRRFLGCHRQANRLTRQLDRFQSVPSRPRRAANVPDRFCREFTLRTIRCRDFVFKRATLERDAHLSGFEWVQFDDLITDTVNKRVVIARQDDVPRDQLAVLEAGHPSIRTKREYVVQSVRFRRLARSAVSGFLHEFQRHLRNAFADHPATRKYGSDFDCIADIHRLTHRCSFATMQQAEQIERRSGFRRDSICKPCHVMSPSGQL